MGSGVGGVGGVAAVPVGGVAAVPVGGVGIAPGVPIAPAAVPIAGGAVPVAPTYPLTGGAVVQPGLGVPPYVGGAAYYPGSVPGVVPGVVPGIVPGVAPVVPSSQGSHDRGSRRVVIEENFDRGQGSTVG